MKNTTLVKNEVQPGRGVFSTIYFGETPIAEKHNGQITTKALQEEVYQEMVEAGLPIDEVPSRFSWSEANRIFSES